LRAFFLPESHAPPRARPGHQKPQNDKKHVSPEGEWITKKMAREFWGLMPTVIREQMGEK
jgi:hypothetical protein